MSNRGGGEQPPDLTEAVLGFRVWSVAIDGRLGAVVAGSFWTPGVNEAVCDPAVAPSRRRHVAPQPGCNCGFNAYFALRKEIRRHHGSLALGAIAAWGAMDVYADGFRAQYAQVIALARPADPDDEGSPVKFHLQRLERAGARYGVPVVPVGKLRETALAHASPVSKTVLPEAKKAKKAKPTPRKRPIPAPPPTPAPPGRQPAPALAPASVPSPPAVAVATWKQARGHGIWIRRHVSVNARESGVEVGLAPGAAALAGAAPEVRVAPISARVAAGACIATVSGAYPGTELHLLTPVGGVVRGHNTAVAAQLRDGDRAVSSAPWLVELEPADSPLEDSPLLWGRPAVEIYRRGVSNQSDADVLDELASVRGFDPGSLQPMAGARVAGLAPHQIETTSVAPEQGRRAAIMVTHLRPLLQACGEGGALLAA